MTSKKILFLYTEIAEYFLAAVEELSRRAELHIVRFPVNKEAPFEFRKLPKVKFYDRNKFTDENLIKKLQEINPDLLIVSGWVDKGYLKAAAVFKNKIPVVLTLDNHWTAGLRQQAARILSPIFIRRKFSHAWVPGLPQKKYAQKLGFPENKIKTGFYTADTKLYDNYYQQYKDKKKREFPRNMLFMGRYIPQKGINTLWQAFIEIQEEQPNDWQLICAGTGSLFDHRVKHSKIKHLGFVQPKDMGKLIANTGIFVLPSNFEPWGVVVHEMAAAGYPMILSNKIGAATVFLEEAKNGYTFSADNKEELKKVMKTIIQTPPVELIEMAEHSRKLSTKISPEIWAETALSFLNSK